MMVFTEAKLEQEIMGYSTNRRLPMPDMGKQGE